MLHLLFVIPFALRISCLSFGNLSCYECEFVDRQYTQALWPCDKSRGSWRVLHGCRACIKQTEVVRTDFRKPKWTPEVTVLKTFSRYCTFLFDPLYPNRCFTFYGSSSVIEQCFCDTDFCNGGSAARFHLLFILISIYIANTIV